MLQDLRGVTMEASDYSSSPNRQPLAMGYSSALECIKVYIGYIE